MTKIIFSILIINLSYSLWSMEENILLHDIKEINLKMPWIKKQKDSGKKLNLIIGRGNLEKDHLPLPYAEDPNVVWIFGDKEIDKNWGRNTLVIDFDNLNNLKNLGDNLFNIISFDWSVLKFFHHLDDIIPLLKNLLIDEGKLYIQAGEQGGMYLFSNIEYISLPDPMPKYPVLATASLVAKNKLFTLCKEQQEKYLQAIFGEGNVAYFDVDACPIYPDKINNLSKYFIATKNN